jgi:hypothetical protein
MPEHGDYHIESRRWYCDYWQSSEEWEEIHDYAPSYPSTKTSNDSFDSRTEEKHEDEQMDLG